MKNSKRMAKNMYTDEELEEAKAFLRSRLDNERSMTADVERLLVMYAGYLLTALFGNSTENDIELLITDLVSQLLADLELLAVDDHDRKDAILLYMHKERHGDTIEGRVRKRVDTFFNEVYAVWLAGKLMNLNYQTLLSSIKANLRDPWRNEVLVAAREKVKRGEIPADYGFDEPHYGKGEIISSYGALDRMLVYAVADAWMYWGFEDARSRGARGYYVVRGSSYPCDVCDSQTGIFFYITDDSHLPPLHLNCMCVVVYSFVPAI